MKTYTEECGIENPIDWDSISKKKTHEFSDAEKEMAKDWKTCPVGNTLAIIKRCDGAPIDPVLKSLGVSIEKIINENNFSDVKNIYTLIKLREKQLISMMLKQLIENTEDLIREVEDNDKIIADLKKFK